MFGQPVKEIKKSGNGRYALSNVMTFEKCAVACMCMIRSLGHTPWTDEEFQTVISSLEKCQTGS